jgi:hypothetical protein
MLAPRVTGGKYDTQIAFITEKVYRVYQDFSIRRV